MPRIVLERAILFCAYSFITPRLFGQSAAIWVAVPSVAAATAHAPVRAADSRARYHRLICLVHLVGSGTQADPVRPEYVPNAAGAAREGIVAWGVQMTDDKTMAIIHVVALSRLAFAPIFARPEVKVFEIGKDSRATIEAAMQKYRKGFDLSQFEVRAQ